MRLPAVRLLPALLGLLLLGAAGCASESSRTIAHQVPLYVAIGASDSVGTGARVPSTEGWVPRLYAMMPAGTRLANLGIGGLRAHDALAQVLPVAVDLKPTVVTVWLGVTDLAALVPLDSYQADLDELLGTLERETKARVYVANLPDLSLLPAFAALPPEELRAEVARWNDAIAATVAAHNAVLVDLFSGWQELRDNPEYVSRDGLHPSSAGYRRVAELFWAAIRERDGE